MSIAAGAKIVAQGGVEERGKKRKEGREERREEEKEGVSGVRGRRPRSNGDGFLKFVGELLQ